MRVRMRIALCSLVMTWLLLAVGCMGQKPADAVPTSPEDLSAFPVQAPVATLSLEDQAAVEATAIIARARATALVMEAQAQATALLEQAGQANAQTQMPETENQPEKTSTPEGSFLDKPAQDPANIVETGFNDVYAVELLNVGYAGEGGFIIVNFKATKQAIDDFWPGRLSIIDEATGIVYDEVATMPIVGPLIGRPREAGQPGYVMIVNTPPGLPPTALVTVKLGNFTQEHVSITH